MFWFPRDFLLANSANREKALILNSEILRQILKSGQKFATLEIVWNNTSIDNNLPTRNTNNKYNSNQQELLE